MTPDGFRSLEAQISELRLALDDSRGNSLDRQARSNGNTSGGVPIPDDATRQHELLRERITRLTRQRNEVTQVTMPTTRDRVRVGHVITLTYADHDSRRQTFRRRRQYQIVGYNEGDCDSTPRRISYETDLAETFLDQTIGYSFPLKIDGKVRTVHLTAIRLITDKNVKRAPAQLLLAA